MSILLDKVTLHDFTTISTHHHQEKEERRMLQIDQKDFGSSLPLLTTTSDQIAKSPDAANASASVHHFDEEVVNKKAAENFNQTVCDPMK